MSEPTDAAALCRSCNREPADATGIGPACRARAAAAMAAMEAATRAAQEAEAAVKAAKAKKTKPAGRLAGDLERLAPADESPEPAPPVRVRVRVSSAGLVPPRVATCIQCPQEKPFRPDPDNTASRCGACVRKNKAAMRDFQGR